MSDILEEYRQKKVVKLCEEARKLCAESSFAEAHGSATGYKSVCELAADNQNLSEYLAQLEKMITDINRIDELARKIWGSVCLLGPEDQDRLAQIIDACEKWRQSPNAEVSDGGTLTHESPAAQSRRSLH